MAETFLDQIDIAKLSEPGGIAGLAEQAEQPESEGEPDDALQEEETGDEEEVTEPEGDEDSGDGDSDEEPDGLTEQERKSVKHFKQEAEDYKAALREMQSKYDQLTQAIIEASQGRKAAPEESEEFEPLDPDAYKKTQEQIDNMTRQQKVTAWKQALTMADMVGAQRYSDFGEAYQHVVQQKASEMAALQGLDANTATQKALQFMQAATFNAFERGADIADTVYNLAKSTGFSGAKKAPEKRQPKPNLEAIEKNRGKTEKKPVQSGQIDGFEGTDLIKSIQNMTKPGRGVDREAFNKMLQLARQG